MENQTPEIIAKHYSRMLESVLLINGIVAGEKMTNDTSENKLDCVDRNVRHLEIMLAKDFWTTEDMAAVNSAIAAGKNFS
jgi:hypothetical protein